MGAVFNVMSDNLYSYTRFAYSGFARRATCQRCLTERSPGWSVQPNPPHRTTSAKNASRHHPHWVHYKHTLVTDPDSPLMSDMLCRQASIKGVGIELCSGMLWVAATHDGLYISYISLSNMLTSSVINKTPKTREENFHYWHAWVNNLISRIQ